jgi:hypothetical protein
VGGLNEKRKIPYALQGAYGNAAVEKLIVLPPVHIHTP